LLGASQISATTLKPFHEAFNDGISIKEYFTVKDIHVPTPILIYEGYVGIVQIHKQYFEIRKSLMIDMYATTTLSNAPVSLALSLPWLKSESL